MALPIILGVTAAILIVVLIYQARQITDLWNLVEDLEGR